MGETWTETQEGISIFFVAFSALLALVLVLSVSTIQTRTFTILSLLGA